MQFLGEKENNHREKRKRKAEPFRDVKKNYNPNSTGRFPNKPWLCRLSKGFQLVLPDLAAGIS